MTNPLVSNGSILHSRCARMGLFRAAWALVLMVAAVAPVMAENLVSLRTTEIAALDTAGASIRLLTVGGRPLALSSEATWILSEDRKIWTRFDWLLSAPIIAMTSDGRQAYLLLGSKSDTAVTGAGSISLVDGKPALKPLPALPKALSAAQATVHKDSLYVAGNDDTGLRVFFSIDPAALAPAWATLAAPPVTGEMTSLVGQTNAVFASFRSDTGKGDRHFRWARDSGWVEKLPVPGSVVAGTTRATGQAHILLLVGNGVDTAPKLKSFHTITGSWATLGDVGKAGATGVRSATTFGNGILWERAAAAGGGSEFSLVEIEAGKFLLTWLDWIVIVVYLVSMLGMGLYFYVREKRMSTSDFFVGGRSIPFWVQV